MCVCWCVYIHTQFLAVYREMGFIAKHLPNKKKKLIIQLECIVQTIWHLKILLMFTKCSSNTRQTFLEENVSSETEIDF